MTSEWPQVIGLSFCGLPHWTESLSALILEACIQFLLTLKHSLKMSPTWKVVCLVRKSLPRSGDPLPLLQVKPQPEFAYRCRSVALIGPSNIKENLLLFLKMNHLIAFLTIILQFVKETLGPLCQEEVIIGYAWNLG